ELSDSGGAVYPILSNDEAILSGPFGDLHNANWGQDGSPTLYIKDIPEDQIEVYSRNSINNNPNVEGVSMFRHKTKNVFYVGDIGFISNQRANGMYGTISIEPFATDDNDFPMEHTRYGRTAQSRSPDYPKPAGSWKIHNSMIFG